jgi:hypothetical protein
LAGQQIPDDRVFVVARVGIAVRLPDGPEIVEPQIDHVVPGRPGTIEDDRTSRIRKILLQDRSVNAPAATAFHTEPILSGGHWGANPPLMEATMAHAQPGLDGRHRDADGEISKKQGNTLIMTLRAQYGKDFARGEAGNSRLRDVPERLDEPSLRKLIKQR